MKRVIQRVVFYLILVLILILFLSNTSTVQKRPEFDYKPKQEQEVVIHNYYSLEYSEECEQSKWVSYVINSKMLSGDTKRSNSFDEDDMVDTKTALSKDYKHSGYDRGHLAPAADMVINDLAMNESFLMSNVSPQVPGFNRGIWKKLEAKVRDFAMEGDGVYVTTGPVLTEFIDTIGVVKRIPVPKYFYKAVLDCKRKKMIAFVLPNEKSSLPLREYVITIDSLEILTGIDFYYDLPDGLEKKLEREICIEKWRL